MLDIFQKWQEWKASRAPQSWPPQLSLIYFLPFSQASHRFIVPGHNGVMLLIQCALSVMSSYEADLRSLPHHGLLCRDPDPHLFHSVLPCCHPDTTVRLNLLLPCLSSWPLPVSNFESRLMDPLLLDYKRQGVPTSWGISGPLLTFWKFPSASPSITNVNLSTEEHYSPLCLYSLQLKTVHSTHFDCLSVPSIWFITPLLHLIDLIKAQPDFFLTSNVQTSSAFIMVLNCLFSETIP